MEMIYNIINAIQCNTIRQNSPQCNKSMKSSSTVINAMYHTLEAKRIQSTTQQKATICNANFYASWESFSAFTVQYTARHCNAMQHNKYNTIQQNSSLCKRSPKNSNTAIQWLHSNAPYSARGTNTKYNTMEGNTIQDKLPLQHGILQSVYYPLGEHKIQHNRRQQDTVQTLTLAENLSVRLQCNTLQDVAILHNIITTMQHNTTEFITMQNKPVKFQHRSTVIAQQCTMQCNGNNIKYNTKRKVTQCKTNYYSSMESFRALTAHSLHTKYNTT